MDGTVGTVGTGGVGNTKTPPVKEKKRRTFVFTVNNPEDGVGTVGTLLLAHKAIKYVYQLEQGEQETLHLQGFVQFKNAISFQSLKKILPRAHIEKCNNIDASISYCQKIDTRVDGPWSYGLPKPIRTIEPNREWQLEILEILKQEADDRTIYWYWETEGGVGKTQFCKWICQNMNAI